MVEAGHDGREYGFPGFSQWFSPFRDPEIARSDGGLDEFPPREFAFELPENGTIVGKLVNPEKVTTGQALLLTPTLERIFDEVDLASIEEMLGAHTVRIEFDASKSQGLSILNVKMEGKETADAFCMISPPGVFNPESTMAWLSRTYSSFNGVYVPDREYVLDKIQICVLPR